MRFENSTVEKKLRVQYLGPRIRDIVGKSYEDVTIPEEATVRDLVDLLSKKYGRYFKDCILNIHGELRNSVAIILDGVNLNQAGGLDTKLGKYSEASLAFMVAVGGG